MSAKGRQARSTGITDQQLNVITEFSSTCIIRCYQKRSAVDASTLIEEVARKETERLDTLLKGRPCRELIEFLKANAITTEYIDKSSDQSSFYFTYGNRYYDPNGSFIGFILFRSIEIDNCYNSLDQNSSILS